MIGFGKGIQLKITTDGTESVQQLSNYDGLKPSITIRADSSNKGTCYVGYNSNPDFPLAANEAITLNWINPLENQLCWKDDGTAGMILYVMG